MSLGLLQGTATVYADIAGIVHKDSPLDSITLRQAESIFLGKIRQLDGGITIIPLDQRSGTPVRDSFYRLTANKTASQIKAYWSRQVFTGQGEPPRTLVDDTQVKDIVAENPNMIGYIDASLLDQTVKTVLMVR